MTNGRQIFVRKVHNSATQKAKQDMQAKKRFINVRTVMDALTKVNASKGIIVKHLWKNGQKHFKLQKHF